MRKKVGCPKSVIKKQIEKYEKIIKDEEYLIEWIENKFREIADCPVCHYRDWCYTPKDRENCPAIVDRTPCFSQEWYKELEMLIAEDDNVRRIRSIVKVRLQYWKEVYDAR